MRLPRIDWPTTAAIKRYFCIMDILLERIKHFLRIFRVPAQLAREPPLVYLNQTLQVSSQRLPARTSSRANAAEAGAASGLDVSLFSGESDPASRLVRRSFVNHG